MKLSVTTYPGRWVDILLRLKRFQLDFLKCQWCYSEVWWFGNGSESESSRCCCPTVFGQIELMHYLKSPYPHSLLPFTQSHKRPKVTGTMETRKTSIPLSYTSNPIKPRHTHARVKKRTQLPLSYHRCQQTEHTGRVTNTQTRTPSCSALSPSLNSFQCILPLACHSSPQYYQSLSPRPHNGSSCSCCICGSRYFKVLAGWIKRGMWKMNSHSQEGHMSWMHNKLREWQGEKKAEEGNGKERGKKNPSQVVWNTVGTYTATISLTQMEIKCIFDFSCVRTIKGTSQAQCFTRLSVVLMAFFVRYWVQIHSISQQ